MDIIVEEESEDLFRPSSNAIVNRQPVRIDTGEVNNDGRPIYRYDYESQQSTTIYTSTNSNGNVTYTGSHDPYSGTVANTIITEFNQEEESPFEDLAPTSPELTPEQHEQLRVELDNAINAENIATVERDYYYDDSDDYLTVEDSFEEDEDIVEALSNISPDGLRIIQVSGTTRYGLEEEQLEYNQQQKLLDNEWLYQKVQEGWLSLETYTQLQIIKDYCETTFPGNWDLQLELSKWLIYGTYDNPYYNRTSRDIQPYGCYFGVEGDRTRYYNENYDYERLYRHEDRHVTRTHSEPKFISSINIIIRFPEVTVSNELGMTMPIKNVYYRFQLVTSGRSYSDKICFRGGLNSHMLSEVQNNCGDSTRFVMLDEANQIEFSIKPLKLLYGIHGLRQSPTVRETVAGYAFSHMRTRADVRGYMSFGVCCLGSGEIAQTLSLLQNDFSPPTFQMLLYQLEAYTIWESLDGGPYIKLVNVLQGDAGTSACHNFNSSYIVKYYKRLIHHRIGNPKRLNWNMNSIGVLQIQDDDLLQDFCRLYDNISTYVTLRDYNIDDRNLTYFRDAQGIYYSTLVTRRSGNMSPRERLIEMGGNDGEVQETALLFRGRQELFEILPNPEEEDDSVNRQVFYINTNVVKYIKEQLEYAANKQKIEADIASRAYAVAHQPRNF